MRKKKQTTNQPSFQELQIENYNLAKQQALSHLYNLDYKPASYARACQYRDSRSYKKKLPNGSYKQIQLSDSTQQLKAFGLGPYFYIQFMRRCTWLFLILSILESIRIYIFLKGKGLQSYTQSFSTYLIKTTIANFDGNNVTKYDDYIVAIVPGVVLVLIFLFYLIWKGHYFSQISDYEENNSNVKPEKFCVEIEGFEDQYVTQEEIEKIFAHFGPIYEVSLVRRHKNKLSYFEELEDLDEQIKEEQLEIILGSGDQQHCNALRKQREELNKYIHTLKIVPKVVSAFVHFQFEKSKQDMLAYYNNHNLFGNKGHAFLRTFCCCCTDAVDQRNLLKGKNVFVKEEKVPEPEDINWESKQITCLSQCCRFIVAAFIIILFLVVSSTIIGLCSIYITSSSTNCEGVTIPSTVAQATIAEVTDTKVKSCFCNSNLVASFSNSQIKTYCQSLLNKIYTQQAIQFAVVITSSIVNFFFGLIVHWLVNFTRPESYSFGTLAKTIVFTIFLILNSIALPILIYADIFGFKATSYVSFLTIVSSDVNKIFDVSSIYLHTDFDRGWYRYVSPIFCNFVIVDTVITWLYFFYKKCCMGKKSLEDEEGLILQKHMNQQITSYKFNIYTDYSYMNLIIFMCVFVSGGIPILIPLCFANLLTRYLTTRNLILINSSKIEGLGQLYNSFVLNFFPVILILSCLFCDWMITAYSTFYPSTIKIQLNGVTLSFLQRQLTLPYFIILAIIIAGYFLFYNTVVRFCSWLASTCHNKKDVVHPYHTLPYSEYVKKINTLHSYNIRNNDKLKNAIINLEKYLTYEQEK